MPPQIVSKIQLMILDIEEASPWAVEQWAESLKNNAERIKAKLDAKIPNSDTFSAKIADPSSSAYLGVLNAAFVSQSGLNYDELLAKQDENLARSFAKFQGKHNFMFETVEGVPAKRFKELVDRAKEDWSKGVAERSLGFTGTKIYEYGLSALSGMWLTADPKVVEYLRGGDKLKVGGPKLICTEANKPSLRTFLNQRLIQSGATLIRQKWLGSAITKQNDQTNFLMNGFRDPLANIVTFSTGGGSHVDWVKIGASYYLEIQVGITP